MDMSIDETRPHLPATQIDRDRRAAKRLEGGDAAVDDAQIEENEPFRIGRPGSRGQKRGGHSRIPKPEILGARQLYPSLIHV